MTTLLAGRAVTTGEPCLDCPYGAPSLPGPYVRCQRCRDDHKTGKAADAQWDLRQRKRDAVNARRARQGLFLYINPRVRDRDRTPSWDRYGRVLREPPRLTAHNLTEIRLALDSMDKAIAAMRDSLKGRL